MEAYAGQQFVGIDLHRRRSVIVRTTDRGDPLETVRINNDMDSLSRVMARAGESPQVVLEATYGWYWAADVLQELGASTHLAHPLGVKAFSYRRVKNDVRDATDLADLLRMGRLPEAWIAPPAAEELRELVGIGPSWSRSVRPVSEIHAVLAKCGIQVLMSDLFSDAGTALLERFDAPSPYLARVESLRRLIDDLDVQIQFGDRPVRPAGPGPAGGRRRLPGGSADPRDRPGPGRGVRGRDRRRAPVPRPGAAGVVGGADPEASESDSHVHRGRITKQGSRLVRWAAIESVQALGPGTGAGRLKRRVGDRRGRNIGKTAAARQQAGVRVLRPARRARAVADPPPSSCGMTPIRHSTWPGLVVQVMTPAHRGAVAHSD